MYKAGMCVRVCMCLCNQDAVLTGPLISGIHGNNGGTAEHIPVEKMHMASTCVETGHLIK